MPHRGNMLLVKGLEYADTDSMCSAALACLGSDCLFYDKGRGGVAAEISIEIMAQGVGLLTGYREYLRQEETAGVAMLLSIKSYEVYCDTIPIDTTLRTTNEMVMEELPIGVYSCKLYRAEDNYLLAKAEITAYKPAHSHALHHC